MKKELLCIVCPTGCRLSAEKTGDAITVTGNSCPRGADFAKAELTCPVRSLTTTVATAFAGAPALPVRTAGEIPKESIPTVLAQLAGVVVEAKLACGDVVAENVAGTGCAVIATSNILRELEG
ncbi:DUF1667 domain-containing protein [Clostridia bacterium OttesenSCG-928-O13]|nr:DUF1667 domain-containing protein [Clostridia bacterium OttesenSCG-928-O13]